MESFREKVSDDFSPQNQADFMRAMAHKWDSIRTWAVYGDGELGGLITFEKLTPWVGTAHFLLKHEFHRKGIAVKAARQAAAEIFEREDVGKLVFYPLAGNLAIGSLLCNIGARREGTLAGHTLCGGKPTAMWVYGLLKTEFLNHASNSDSSGSRGPRLDRGVASERRAQDHENKLDHQLVE
jgi:RimJ/RimL family protein N-acetyltransferase